MRNKYIITFILMLSMIFITQNGFSAGPKMGTAAAIELQIPMGARSVGMGCANIANVAKTEAIYWNPAGLSALPGAQVDFSYLTYFADMKISYLTAGYTLEKIGTIGLSLQSMDIGDIEVTTLDAPDGTGELFTPDFLTLVGTFSRQFTDRISFGINTKLISREIHLMSATALAFDFGLQYRSDINIDFGIVLRNIGSSLQFDGTGAEFDSDIPFADPNATTRKTRLVMAENELPATLDMGLSYRYTISEQHKLNISGLFSNNSYALDAFTGGVEYNYQDMVFLRTGYTAPIYPDDFQGAKEYQFGLTLGAGVDLNVGENLLHIDYAYRDMDLFDGNNYFTLGFEF
jgi:opacity protein-like surface antigen